MTEKIDIAEQLNILIDLQGIDGQIYMLTAEKEARPEEIRCLKESITHKQAALKEAEANLKTLQVKRKEKEVELESQESAIKKLQMQLYQLKTNKEYTAMLHEIESHRADKSLLEDEILKLMDMIDAAEAKVNNEKKNIEGEAKRIDNQVQAIEASIKEIESNLAELKKKRGGITPTINTHILKDYERILTGKDGLALVEVINDACGGCYMHLPPQVINEIRLKEQIVFCESCQRILYIKDEQP